MSSFVSALCTLALLSVFATLSWAGPPSGLPSSLVLAVTGSTSFDADYGLEWMDDPGGWFVTSPVGADGWILPDGNGQLERSGQIVLVAGAFGALGIWEAISFVPDDPGGGWAGGAVSSPEPLVGAAAMGFFLFWRRRS